MHGPYQDELELIILHLPNQAIRAGVLHPLYFRPHLTYPHRLRLLLIIIVPPPLLPLIEVNIKLRTALLTLTPPPPPKMECGKLEPTAVKRDERCELGILGGVRDWTQGFGRRRRDEGCGMLFLTDVKRDY